METAGYSLRDLPRSYTGAHYRIGLDVHFAARIDTSDLEIMARFFLLLGALLGSCAAFAPTARPAVAPRSIARRSVPVVAELEVQDTWWGECLSQPQAARTAIGAASRLRRRNQRA